MENVFTAIAEPTRRQLLARLRQSEPLSLNELAEPLSISRQAVSKHLDVLCAAGLVETRRQGRAKLHRLNPAPLRVVEDWLAPYAREWDRRLDRLKRHLEDSP